jgi:hypothetical protein
MEEKQTRWNKIQVGDRVKDKRGKLVEIVGLHYTNRGSSDIPYVQYRLVKPNGLSPREMADLAWGENIRWYRYVGIAKIIPTLRKFVGVGIDRGDVVVMTKMTKTSIKIHFVYRKLKGMGYEYVISYDTWDDLLNSCVEIAELPKEVFN